jgi:hypothetical protein
MKGFISRRHSLTISPRNKLDDDDDLPIYNLEIKQKTMNLSNLQIKMAKTSEYNNSHHMRSIKQKQKHMGSIMQQIDRIRFTPRKP